MASAPGSESVTGRIDSAGRLIEADAMLTDLQHEAGSSVGDRLALPQLAAVARLARKLGVGIARPAVVAGRDHDLELWVRAEPDGADVVITIESWRRRPPHGPRLEIAARSEDVLPQPKGEWATDAELRITELSPDLASILGAQTGEAIGQPLTKWLRLMEGDDGAMPLLTAVAARTAFAGQIASSRNGPGQRLVFSGNPVSGADGLFDGFRGRAAVENVARPEAANEAGNAGMSIDPALDHALRSPLARIIEAAEGIADRADGPLRSDYAAYAGDISAAAKHLLSVIRAMVDQPPESDASIDLSPLVDEAIGPGAVEGRASRGHDRAGRPANPGGSWRTAGHRPDPGQFAGQRHPPFPRGVPGFSDPGDGRRLCFGHRGRRGQRASTPPTRNVFSASSSGLARAAATPGWASPSRAGWPIRWPAMLPWSARQARARASR